jgi:serine/threonine protein kinase
LAGKYQLLATLGQGGMADVYLAVARGPLGFNKLVVLKRLRTHAEDEGQTLQMFLDEARLAARLNHPNIVDTYDVGSEGDSYFIAMEYLDGQPLSRILKSTRRSGVNPTAWVYIVAEALHGLHHAHELKDYDGASLQIVHRDVSPHNIFVTYEAEVKVVDFGIAKATLNVAQTEAGLLKGKIGYMPPEQALGHEVDRRADIFSMGVVLWEALSGRRLLEGGMATVFAKLVHSDVPKLLEVKPDIDQRLAAIVDRALEKRPENRYATAAEMRDALLEYARRVPKAATKNDIARLMAEVFGSQRAAVQQDIEKHLANAMSGAPRDGNFWDTTKLLVSPEVTISALAPTPGEPTSREIRTSTALLAPPPSAGSVTHAAAATTLAQSEETPPVRSSRGKLVAILAGVVVAAAAGAVFAIRVGHKLPEPATVTPVFSQALTIESEPSGAFVSWNGQTMGITPLTFQLPRGLQTLVVSKQGYTTEPVVIDLGEVNGPVSRIVALKSEQEVAIPSNAVAPGTRRSYPSSGARSYRSRRERANASNESAAEARQSATTTESTTTPRAEPTVVPQPIVESPRPPPAPSPEPPPPTAPTAAPGTLDGRAVTSLFAAHRGEIDACIERARMDHADLHGRLQVQINVAPTGRVIGVSAVNPIENGARLHACVLSAIQKWTFPAPAGGVNGSITRTFVIE